MTTMERLATINVTINFALPVECLSLDDFAAMDVKVLDDLYQTLYKEEEADYYGIKKMSAERKGLYYDIVYYYDNKYYYDNIDAFIEYKSHMNEPDFDWDFYSDWHKDMYGFRPH